MGRANEKAIGGSISYFLNGTMQIDNIDNIKDGAK